MVVDWAYVGGKVPPVTMATRPARDGISLMEKSLGLLEAILMGGESSCGTVKKKIKGDEFRKARIWSEHSNVTVFAGLVTPTCTRTRFWYVRLRSLLVGKEMVGCSGVRNWIHA